MISLPRAALRPPGADFALPWADLLCPFGAEAFTAQSVGAVEAPVIRPVAHPENPKDTKTLRYVARARNGAGFIFLNNIQAWVDMQDQKDVQLRVSLPDA
jgi:hypothetical protein